MIRPAQAPLNSANRLLQVVGLSLAPVGVLAVLVAQDPADLAGFAMILLSALLPLFLWVRAGAPGMPLLPAISGMYMLYFGLPALRGAAETVGNNPDQVLKAAFTVALFLISSALAWFVMINGAPRTPRRPPVALPTSSLNYFIFFGLSLGAIYYFATFTGLLGWLGPLSSVVRAVTLTSGSLACYLLGHARARRSLRGAAWFAAVALLVTMVAFALATLFLVGAAIFSIAAVFGYFVTTKRVPWRLVIGILVAFSILQAGKSDMRQRYWLQNANYSTTSVFSVPGLMLTWATTGIGNLAGHKGNDTIIDRTSLLNQLIRVQRLTPDAVPYMNGETYTHLPSMLVPRFVNANKISSQEVMNELNVRYGFLTREDTRITAAGWNLIAEAHANFGQAGAVIVGFFFGLLTGLFTRWSIGVEAVSLPMLLAIAAFVTMLNLEADLSYLMTNLFQSSIAVLLFFFLLNVLVTGRLNVRRGRAPPRLSPTH